MLWVAHSSGRRLAHCKRTPGNSFSSQETSHGGSVGRGVVPCAAPRSLIWAQQRMWSKCSGPIHTGHRKRHVGKLEHFPFDVAWVQCGHPHSHQQVPFPCIALRVASCVLCGLGLRSFLCGKEEQWFGSFAVERSI